MSVIVWLMMGIAVWHFTVFVPDRFRGGSSAPSSPARWAPPCSASPSTG